MRSDAQNRKYKKEIQRNSKKFKEKEKQWNSETVYFIYTEKFAAHAELSQNVEILVVLRIAD